MLPGSTFRLAVFVPILHRIVDSKDLMRRHGKSLREARSQSLATLPTRCCGIPSETNKAGEIILATFFEQHDPCA
jgi:hypothetical protein